MDDETAPEPRYIPHELVSRILLLLPVKSLMRFTCVCKTWHNTITGDQSFHHGHHGLQEPCVLIAPLIKTNDGGPSPIANKKVTTPGLYRWEKSQGTVTLVQAMDSFPAEEAKHKFAHCNGLVLMPMDGTVRVLNPATRHVLTLPQSTHNVMPNWRAPLFRGALGLGHDPRSNTYKVVRFFYRYLQMPMGSCRDFTLGMEVFTIGRDQHWRETAVPPPYPIIAGQTTTFFKGSLLWTIDESLLEDDQGVRGFLRFNLEDESFSVTPAPPGCPRLQYMVSNLAEMSGELYFVNEGAKYGSFHPIWVCRDVNGVDPPQWVQLQVIRFPRAIHMIAAFNDGIVFQGGSHGLFSFDSQMTRGFRRVASMHDLRYHHPDTNTYVEYTEEIAHGYDLIPYVPSLVRI